MRCQAIVVFVALGAILLAKAEGGAAPSGAAGGGATPLSADAFERHIVQEGETLFAVARRYHTSVTALAQINGLEDISRLAMGQLLLVPRGAASPDLPPRPGVVPSARDPQDSPAPRPATHTVQGGDTLFAVARRYQVSVDLLLELNATPDPQRLTPRQVLRLVPKAPAPSRSPAPYPTPERAAGPPSPAPSKTTFAWPLQGPVLRPFGQEGSPSLLLEAPEGTPIRAAAAGTVLAAGWMKGFGNAVYLQHSGGIATFYGNCGIFFCQKGATVRQGDRLAAVGPAPDSGPAHLAFTVLKNGKAVDPMTFLPKK